jgi:hypothetical protein
MNLESFRVGTEAIEAFSHARLCMCVSSQFKSSPVSANGDTLTGMVTCHPRNLGSTSDRGQQICISKCSEWYWGPPSLLFSWYQELFPREVKYLVPTLRMNGAVPTQPICFHGAARGGQLNLFLNSSITIDVLKIECAAALKCRVPVSSEKLSTT